VIQNVVVIPVVFRPRVAAISNRLRDAVQSGWDKRLLGARVLVEGVRRVGRGRAADRLGLA